MSVEKVTNLIASFERGGLTESWVFRELIDLAGVLGAEPILSALSERWLSLLKQQPLVSRPPSKAEDLLVIESYCGPELTKEAMETATRSAREKAYRGAWALHRALWSERMG